MKISERSTRWTRNWRWVLGLGLAGLTGCASVPRRSASGVESAEPVRKDQRGGVYYHVPRVEVRTRQKFNPVFWFGNEDDPVPPDWYRPGEKRRVRKWYFRNPLHNFMFYVIGIADKEFDRVGRYPVAVFAPDQGWNWTVCRYKCVRLPFISYQKGRFKCYFGWRNKGNFGIELKRTGKKSEPEVLRCPECGELLGDEGLAPMPALPP